MNFKFFTHFTTLVIITTSLAYPQRSLHQPRSTSRNYGHKQKLEQWVRPTTYDEIIQMLEDLESGALEKQYSPAQLEHLNDYLATLAKEGILPNELEEQLVLEEDIYDLMCGEDSAFQLGYYLGDSHQYTIIPSVCNGQDGYDIVQCGKISNTWRQTKRFVKKHKKAIIIGAVVVVAVVAITVAVVVASSAVVAGATAGAVSAAASSGSNDNPPKQSGLKAPFSETPVFDSVMEEQILAFKENLARENFFGPTTHNQTLTLEETGRIVGPLFAHDSFNHFNNYSI